MLNEYLSWLNSNYSNRHGHRGLDVEEQTDAVVYIVVVLLFYSFGIIFMMVKYMRHEHREWEESKLYMRYINAARDQGTNRGRLTNRLALQALNTVNVIPQTTRISGKVTFV
uniref:Uncharacterized protein n=1 Tax=Strigamia maritima TaxID=126957 RepID=T1JEY9_STRMM